MTQVPCIVHRTDDQDLGTQLLPFFCKYLHAQTTKFDGGVAAVEAPPADEAQVQNCQVFTVVCGNRKLRALHDAVKGGLQCDRIECIVHGAYD